MAAASPVALPESALAARWAQGAAGPLRLEDGRPLRVIFPGVPGGASGPDFTGAILDAGGDLLRGDVELHLRASGWQAHGHDADDAYAGVVLHVVAANDLGASLTLHRSGRLIPVLVLPSAPAGLPGFIPPCALEAARGREFAATLERMSLRRLRAKAARVQPLTASGGSANALYSLALETLGGSANREAFAALARRLPLASLLESAEGASAPRALALSAALKGAAATLAVRRAGLRPMASPSRRLDAAGALFARWWPAATPSWPAALQPPASWRIAAAPGIGRAAAIELLANAVLPVALAARCWPEPQIEEAWRNLPSPGTYGRLRPLEGWLSGPAAPPFPPPARLQGGLLLHNDYCTKGACGRCPLTS